MWKFLAGVAVGVIGTIIYEDKKEIREQRKRNIAGFVENDSQEEITDEEAVLKDDAEAKANQAIEEAQEIINNSCGSMVTNVQCEG